MSRHGIPCSLLVVAILAIFCPWDVQSSAIGHAISDLSDHYWGAWWWGSELLAGRLPIRSELTHAPFGAVLWHPDPVGALLALALRPLGFPLAWNAALLVQLIACAGILYASAYRWLDDSAAAFFVGLAGTVSAFSLGIVHSGLSEYVGLALPVLFIILLYRDLEEERSGIGSGIALGLCTLQALYYGAFAGLFACCMVIGPSPLRRARVVLKSLLVGGVLSAPVLWWVFQTLASDASVAGVGQSPGWDQAQLPAMRLSLFLQPAGGVFPDTPALGNPGILQAHYLGVVLTGLAVWGFRACPALRPHGLGLLVFAVLALGPAAVVGPVEVGAPVKAVPLPAALLYMIPESPWRFVHHPYRVVAFVLPVLAFAAGWALKGRRKRWVLLATTALLIDVMACGSVPWPVSRSSVQFHIDDQIVERHDHVSCTAPGLLDWPPDATFSNRMYLLAHVEHQRPIPYGVNTFLSGPVLADPLVQILLHQLEDLPRRTRNRDVPQRLELPRVPAEAVTNLCALGIGEVRLHGSHMSKRETKAATALLDASLTRIESDGSTLRWASLRSE